MKSVSRLFRIVAALAVLQLVMACTIVLLHEGRIASAAAPSVKPAITINHYAFHPATLTVQKGDTVTWVNKDDDVHTIKSTDGPDAFASTALDNGSQFSFTFHHAGTYHYICTVHPYMHGVIVVR